MSATKTAYDLLDEGVTLPEKARFRALNEATLEDWAAIVKAGRKKKNDVLGLCLEHLENLKEPDTAFPIDRYDHSLQTATRAWRAGFESDDEMIAAALLHDIGDFFAPFNHGEFVAAIFKPYVRPEIYWMLKFHEMFQGYHCFQYFGLDPNAVDAVRDHPFAETCRRFCDDWDQAAFDPDYESMPLEAFMPTLSRVFAKPKRMVYDRIHED